jgi:hypothetical protein
MNVNSLITRDYRKKDDFAVQKNKPKTNPISEKPKINVSLYFIKEYENETAFRPQKNKAKTNPISEIAKMNVNAFSKKDYENGTAHRPKKTKQNKACPERSRMGQFSNNFKNFSSQF